MDFKRQPKRLRRESDRPPNGGPYMREMERYLHVPEERSCPTELKMCVAEYKIRPKDGNADICERSEKWKFFSDLVDGICKEDQPPFEASLPGERGGFHLHSLETAPVRAKIRRVTKGHPRLEARALTQRNNDGIVVGRAIPSQGCKVDKKKNKCLCERCSDGGY